MIVQDFVPVPSNTLPRLVVTARVNHHLIKRIIEPDVLVAVQAKDKWLVYWLADDSRIFDEGSLTKVRETFPEDYLIQVRANWLIKPPLVYEAELIGDSWNLKIKGLPCTVPVSRRRWKEVKKKLRLGYR